MDLGPDDSEFVEVDPTGRYGRVCDLSLDLSVLYFFSGLQLVSISQV